MKYLFCCVLYFIFLGGIVSAQHNRQTTLEVPQLKLRNSAIELILIDIDAFMSDKPNGLNYPISKIVFSELDDITCFRIEGVDNSWSNLFTYGEICYGYVVMFNRFFLVTAESYNDMRLDKLFYQTGEKRIFSRVYSLPSLQDRFPTWFFEFNNNKCYLVGVEDLDTLD